MSGKDMYKDTFSPEHFSERRKEVAEELARILKQSGIPVKGERIIEVGAGAGGETAGIRDFFPEAYILAIDRDADVLRGKTSQFADDVVQADVSDILRNNEEARDLFESADTVMALRTSAVLAHELLTRLSDAGFTGVLVTSFIEQSERGQVGMEAVAYIRRLLWDTKNAIRVVALKESRWHNESAFVRVFGDSSSRGR